MKKQAKGQSQHFLNEDAITSSGEDIFNFKPYAKKIQRLIQNNSSNPNPLTIGIYGKWGEGKTSFMNLVKEGIDIKHEDRNGVLVYNFNPWRYSTEDEMLFDFFDGLSKTMIIAKNGNIKKAGERIVKLSNYLKAVKLSATVGIPGFLGGKIEVEPDKILKKMGQEIQGEELTIENLSKKVDEHLIKADYKIAVFIDDLDRLDKDEIYTILKLIKLNAHFKNFVYLLTLDQEHAAKAISKRYGEGSKDGNLFLEKIINIPVQLPRIAGKDLSAFFELKLSTVFRNLEFENRKIKAEEIKEIYDEFRADYFKSPREIIRILNSFFIAAFAIGEEVYLRDLFWIETIKIQNENLYNVLKNYEIDDLFSPEVIDFYDGTSLQGESIGGIRIVIEKEYKDYLHIIKFLFPERNPEIWDKKPSTQKLVYKLRINTKTHYSKYFSYNVSDNISNTFIFKLEKFSREKNPKELSKALHELLENDVDGRSFYLFQNFIKTVENGKLFFFKFVLENLSLLPKVEKLDIFGRNLEISTIELIATQTKNSDFKEDVILSILESLDVFQLCHFTRKFEPETSIRERLEKKAVDLFKKGHSDILFFEQVRHGSNSMILHSLKKYDPQFLTQYLEKNLDNISRLKNLIRSFAPFWNGEFFGPIERNNYDYILKIIDVNIVFNKIKILDRKRVDRINLSDYQIPMREEATAEENLDQFIYWYKRDLKDREDSRSSNDFA